MTRVVIVGAGHNGLVAAIHLAAHGLDVTVLEHAPRPGGASTSVASTLPGFVHDHCAAFVPMTAASPAMRELELDGSIGSTRRWCSRIRSPTARAIALHRDVEETVRSLGAAGRRLGGGDGAAAAAGDAARRDGPRAAPAGARPRCGSRSRCGATGSEWARRLAGSVEALGLDLFEGDRRATAWLSASAQHSGLPPTAAASGAFGLPAAAARAQPRLAVPARRDAGARRRAGPARASARARRSAATHRRAGARPRRTRRRRAARRRRGGRQPTRSSARSAPACWRGCCPPGAARPPAPAAADLALRHRAVQARLRPLGPGAVDRRGAARGGGRACRRVSSRSSRARPTRRGAARCPSVPRSSSASSRCMTRRARRPAGTRCTFTATSPRATRSPTRRSPTACRRSSNASRPGFGSLVLARRRARRAQTERENPSLVGGDLAGGSYELDQQLIFRPAPELCRYRSPLRGLYVAGASTHPGGAVHGMSGRGAARALLRDRRLGRRLPFSSTE